MMILYNFISSFCVLFLFLNAIFSPKLLSQQDFGTKTEIVQPTIFKEPLPQKETVSKKTVNSGMIAKIKAHPYISAAIAALLVAGAGYGVYRGKSVLDERKTKQEMHNRLEDIYGKIPSISTSFVYKLGSIENAQNMINDEIAQLEEKIADLDSDIELGNISEASEASSSTREFKKTEASRLRNSYENKIHELQEINNQFSKNYKEIKEFKTKLPQKKGEIESQLDNPSRLDIDKGNAFIENAINAEKSYMETFNKYRAVLPKKSSPGI